MINKRSPTRLAFGLLPILTAAGLALAAVPASAAPTAPNHSGPNHSGQTCELHVWAAGRPNFKPSARLEAIVARSNTPDMLDRDNPSSNVNLFDPANRIRTLSDDMLRRLLPRGSVATIVRHGEIIDTDATPLAGLKGRSAPSDAACYAELILASSYAILPGVRGSEAPLPNHGTSLLQQGLEAPVGALLAGGNRLVMEFWLRDFPGSTGLPLIVKRKNDSRLPRVEFVTEALRDALIVSANDNLGNFADFASKKRQW